MRVCTHFTEIDRLRRTFLDLMKPCEGKKEFGGWPYGNELELLKFLVMCTMHSSVHLRSGSHSESFSIRRIIRPERVVAVLQRVPAGGRHLSSYVRHTRV